MSITDKKPSRGGVLANKEIVVNFVSALTQTGLKVFEFKPGYNFEVVGVRVYTSAYTATASVDVHISNVSVLSSVITPVTTTEVVGALKTDVRTLRGDPTKVLQVKYTTNGTGVIANPQVTLIIRPTETGGYSA